MVRAVCPLLVMASACAADPSTADKDGGVAVEDAAAVADASFDSHYDRVSGYDDLVLADRPVAYWAMDRGKEEEPDLTGNGHTGRYPEGTAALVALPNGDQAADFNGRDQHLIVPSSAAFSTPTTGNLTWEAWIRPDVLTFPSDDGVDGYVDWMGKCQDYAPTCEWEARMYSTVTAESRPSRLSAYVFNPGASLGASADWQPDPGEIEAGAWYHVVGQYTTQRSFSDCPDADTYPGSIEIWVNGVKWDHASHGETGCLSQYKVVPRANDSALLVGTMARDTWFAGAIGKVAIYDKLLGDARIAAHFEAMTGHVPTGHCGDTCRL